MTSAGEILPASAIDDLDDRISTLEDPPGVCVYCSVDSAIPDVTDTAISFDNERYDEGGWFTATSDELTVPSAGIYRPTANVTFESSATGTRVAWITANGTTIAVDRRTAINGAVTPLTVVASPVQLSAGVVLKLLVRHSAGGPLNVLGAGTDATSSIFSVEFVRPL